MTMPDARSGGTPGAGLGDEAGMSGTSSTGGSAGGGTASDAREQIRHARDQVVDQAKSTMRQARDRAGSTLDDSRRRLADQLGGVAHAFQRCSEEIRGEGPGPVAGLTESVARRAERAAGYLREGDLRSMTRDLESLTRRQPAAVLAGAFGIGVLAARFLKSSEPEYGGEDPGYERIGPGEEPAGLGAGLDRDARGGFDASA